MNINDIVDFAKENGFAIVQITNEENFCADFDTIVFENVDRYVSVETRRGKISVNWSAIGNSSIGATTNFIHKMEIAKEIAKMLQVL
jgi:orotate phosphoribosyltransferase-like protein